MKDEGQPSTISDFPMSENDLRVAIKAHDMGLLRSLCICFPACIYAYDRTTHTADVMPLIKQGYYNGSWKYMRRELIRGVRVRNIQCGGFTIDIPVFVGDTGWVFASDRNTRLLMQEGALTNSVLSSNRPMSIIEDDYQQKPDQMDIHSFQEGVFIPDNWGKWDVHRFKDNPGGAVSTSLYLGSSIDTDDGRPDIDNKTFQHGDVYEKNTTCSISMQVGGGVTIASSGPTAKQNEEDKDEQAPQVKNVQMSIVEKSVAITAENETEHKSTSLSVDADGGISIRQEVNTEEDSEKGIAKCKQQVLCSLNSKEFVIRLMDATDGKNPKSVTFSFSGGELQVSTTDDVQMRFGGDVNIQSRKDVNLQVSGKANLMGHSDINLNTSGNVQVAANDARVVARNDASVVAKKVSVVGAEEVNINSGETVNVGAVKTTNVNAGENVNLAAGKVINLTAPDEVTLVTAAKATVVAKKKGAEVQVSTLSRDSAISINCAGKNSEIDISTIGENSPISINTEGTGASIDIKTSGGNANVGIAASGAGSKISMNGEVEIAGSLKLNDKVFRPAAHPLGDDQYANYWEHD